MIFADAYFASRATTRGSVSGGVMCGRAALGWFSGAQKCVGLSISEAEYVALADRLKRALFMKHGDFSCSAHVFMISRFMRMMRVLDL